MLRIESLRTGLVHAIGPRVVFRKAAPTILWPLLLLLAYYYSLRSPENCAWRCKVLPLADRSILEIMTITISSIFIQAHHTVLKPDKCNYCCGLPWPLGGFGLSASLACMHLGQSTVGGMGLGSRCGGSLGSPGGSIKSTIGGLGLIIVGQWYVAIV